MNRALMVMIGIAGGVAGVFLVAAGSKKSTPARAPTPAPSSAPPWVMPGLPGTPIKIKSRDTSVTSFPVDVWSLPSPPPVYGVPPTIIDLNVASDDPTSFVAYDAGNKAVFARGPGPLTAQIAASL